LGAERDGASDDRGARDDERVRRRAFDRSVFDPPDVRARTASAPFSEREIRRRTTQLMMSATRTMIAMRTGVCSARGTISLFASTTSRY
jgi:hypothetical protein